ERGHAHAVAPEPGHRGGADPGGAAGDERSTVSRRHDRALSASSAMALEIPIRWRDIDALGHVNNAVYYSYVEELLAAVLDPVLGAGWVTTRIELDFRRE